MSITTANIYTSPSSQDPSGVGGFTGAGNIWVQSDTGVWLSRNSTNTAWVPIGSGDQQSFGLMPLSGGAMSGAVTGSSNMMTADGSTPFALPPNVTSRNSLMATLADLTALQNNLSTLISETVSQAVASIPVPGVNSNLSIAVTQVGGQLTPSPYNATVLLPYQSMVYANGTAVQLSECHGFASWGQGILSTNPQYLTPQDSRGMSWQSYTTSPNTAIPFNYLIIAISTTS